ncbi:MAG: hypothetical protein ISR47_00715 [Rhodospirillales bacterium]|nr:hypothetical protein [Rhodospirillales bacterium]
MDIVEQLRAASAGHLYDKIPWPNKLLREAANEIMRLRKILEETGLDQKAFSKRGVVKADFGEMEAAKKDH